MARGPSPSLSSSSASRGNRLLALLPDAEFERFMARAERVTVPAKQLLAEAGEPPRHGHFPLSCVLSAIIPLRDGSAIEAATIGNEGFGAIDFLSARSVSVYKVIGQVDGEALRVPAAELRAMLEESGALRRVLEQYVLTVVHQSGQNAACNARHEVEERLCRWLLMTHDRVGKDEFYLTQEFLGIMLGVRRQSVSLAAATLQEAGLIAYSRGHMKILNRPGLEAASCECYEAIRETYEQVMCPPA